MSTGKGAISHIKFLHIYDFCIHEHGNENNGTPTYERETNNFIMRFGFLVSYVLGSGRATGHSMNFLISCSAVAGAGIPQSCLPADSGSLSLHLLQRLGSCLKASSRHQQSVLSFCVGCYKVSCGSYTDRNRFFFSSDT